MRKVPLRAIPASFRTPQSEAICLLMSATRGMSMGPSPPTFLGSRVHLLWTKWESMEQPTTSQPFSLKVLAWLLKSTISVGQTKVKSRGQKKRSSHLLLQSVRESSLNQLEAQTQELALKKGAAFPMIAFAVWLAIRYIFIKYQRFLNIS